MQLKHGNSISDERFEAAAERLIEIQNYEYECVHDGSGRSEEMPSDLERRHAREWERLKCQRRTLSIMQWVKLFPHTL